MLGGEGSSQCLTTMLMSDSDPAEYPQERLQQYLTNLQADVKVDDEEASAGTSTQVSLLLLSCADAIAADDLQKAYRLVNALRERVSPTGSGEERLGHYIADALVARITGTGGLLSHGFRCSINKFLHTYKLAAEVFPTIGLSVYFINQNILERTETAQRVHVVDYGIGHGFRWLCLLKDFSERPGGPPHFRLTGVECPDHYMYVPPEDIGVKLSAYARLLGVPFEFHGVSSNSWDLLQPSELKARPDDKEEVLVVTCIYRLRHLLDEPCMVGTPRKKLLSRIQSMKPKLFIQAAYPASCNSPLLVERIREAYDYYRGIYGAIEEIIPEGRAAERQLMETIHGMDLLNMLACEGQDRKERPECYRQWQVLLQHTGFKQASLKHHVYLKAMEMVRTYRGSFSVRRRSNWLLVYWKQHLLSAMTAWTT